MYFLIKDDKLLEKYNIIQDKFGSNIKKGLDSESVDRKKYLRNKIKFQAKKKKKKKKSQHCKMQKEDSDCIYLSLKKMQTMYKVNRRI